MRAQQSSGVGDAGTLPVDADVQAGKMVPMKSRQAPLFPLPRLSPVEMETTHLSRPCCVNGLL